MSLTSWERAALLSDIRMIVQDEMRKEREATNTANTITLDAYEVTNLHEALLVLRRLGLDTGDWLGQILWKLTNHPEFGQTRPNVLLDDQIAQVMRKYTVS